MPKNLVIVESPAKARTIEKYLGKDFTVLASVGHVKDLPASELGVDIEAGFVPKYTTIKGKKKVIDQLKKEAKTADTVYLAPDPDREGEAIAWHIAEEIKKSAKNIVRVQFNEITKRGVQDGIDHPGPINQNRVDAQQSRRILDRLVGYLVSPLLWKPLKYGLSAGRVQSVALRMIVEREEEIERFVPEEYWSVEALFDLIDAKTKKKGSLTAKLDKKNGEKLTIPNREAVDAILRDLESVEYSIADVEKKTVKKSAPQPFITSRLQQDASRKLGFSAKKTMMLAQQLYEGIELGTEGPVGLITYMRTDSTRVSEDAVTEAHGYIEKTYGKEFLPEAAKKAKAKKGPKVQDAHEAIRPTSVLRTPDEVKRFLSDDQMKMYKLIWDRFVASQMADAKFNQVTVIINGGPYEFRANARTLQFAGFLSVYQESTDDDANGEDGGDALLFDVARESEVNLKNIEEKQHFTMPPPRYTEASLVRVMEQKGIGRPSTYASIIATIQDRGYVELKEKKFWPTELGRIVIKLLIANFPSVFEVEFTAGLEEKLDNVEEGDIEWKKMLEEFYTSFRPILDKAEDKFVVDLTLDAKCPEDGAPLTIKYGKKGPFAACTNYPDCKFTSDFERDEQGGVKLVAPPPEEGSGVECEKCGRELVVKRTRFGEMLACPGYPECKNIKNFIRMPDKSIKVMESGEKINHACPQCDGGELVIKSGRNGVFVGCSNYPSCRFTADITVNEDGTITPKVIKVDKVDCEKCGSEMVLKSGPRGRFLACSGYPKCKNTKAIKELEDGTITAKDK